jgi:outer membrane immunogenic protein
MMTKKFLLAGVAILALGVGAASAADIARRPAPYKAPAFVEPQFTWTGLYAGAFGGGAWGRSDFSAPLATGTFDTDGWLAGGTIGYNYQLPNNIVLGIEGDAAWTDIKGSAACPAGICETKNDWLATVRGRAGYAFGRFLPYITGGAAFGDIKTSATGLGSSTTTRAGWTVGGGLEANIAGPWSAKVEYLYVDLGRGGSILGSDASFKTNIVRAGINYKF